LKTLSGRLPREQDKALSFRKFDAPACEDFQIKNREFTPGVCRDDFAQLFPAMRRDHLLQPLDPMQYAGRKNHAGKSRRFFAGMILPL